MSDTSSEESSSEEEDEGELATEALDSEIIATINAIKTKDPRVYDTSVKFYTDADSEAGATSKVAKEKPMHLRDYHRQNLLNGVHGEDVDEQPLTYNEEQERLKESVVAQMHAAAQDSDASESEEGFLKAKAKSKRPAKEPELDVDNADKDPELFLSNFMASRAWAQQDERQLQPFESDDEEEDRKADEFEAAYNLRYEDPEKSNEKLQSHSRDIAAKYSVRREETNPRQRKREAEKAAKEAVRQERREEKARYRKLKIEEVEDKVRKIKQAAGIRTQDLQPEDWQRFVDEDWDDDKWDEEMQKRFGEEYYAEADVLSEDEEGSKKPKKPKFDDDIDIKDIVPDFEEEDERPDFSLSDEDAPKAKKPKQVNEEKKRQEKKERRIIEQLVDDQLQMDLDHALPKSSKSKSGFRYRETSPKTFGLTSRDILLADDSQLNQFAGLKKLAAFRDSERKRKDQKHLSKKNRLRQWRRDVFGNEEGLQDADLVPSQAKPLAVVDEDEDGGVNILTEGKSRKKRRGKKQKTAAV